MSRSPITREGFTRIREELERMKREDRVQVIKEIGAARSHGDISENAEYHAAREKQGWIEAKIRDLETRLASSEIMDVPKGDVDRVCFGARVKVEDVNSGEVKLYQVVGPYESDIDQGRLSITSPLARAMLGKAVGEEVVVQAPGKTTELEILEVMI